jgi:hypothetical protein
MSEGITKNAGEDFFFHFLIDSTYPTAIPKERNIKIVPLFFYRYPIFSGKKCNCNASNSRQAKVYTRREISTRAIKFVELIAVFAEKMDDQHIVSRIPHEVIENRMAMDPHTCLDEVCDIDIYFEVDMSVAQRMSLFSGYRYDREKRVFVVNYTQEYIRMLAADYGFPIGRYADDLWGLSEKTAAILRAVLSVPFCVEHGISLPKACVKAGMELSGMEITRLKKEFRSNIGAMREIGVVYDEARQRFIYDKNNYRVHLPPVLAKSSMEEAVTLTEKMRKKAEEMNMDPDEEFEKFKVFLKGKNYKSHYRAWGHFLKQKSKSKKEEEKTGAKVLVYDEVFKEISKKHGIDDAEAITIFTKFKNHHIVKETVSNKWSYLWENYLITGIEINKKRTISTHTERNRIEMDFYAAQLVSTYIKEQIKTKGISISDVISGKVQIEGLEFVSLPVPPSLGRGNETIFRWKDRNIQEKMMQKYREPSPAPEIQPKGR